VKIIFYLFQIWRNFDILIDNLKNVKIMKKFFFSITLASLTLLSLYAQPVSDYTYKLSNGINIKMDRCWNQVWVQQSYAPMSSADKTPLSVSVRAMGYLISGSAFNLMKSGKEVKLQGAAPGTYDLKMTFKLSGTPGSLSFLANNIIIKPGSKTSVSITLYDYQFIIVESAAQGNNLCRYKSQINIYKANSEQNMYTGVFSFYAKGNHNNEIAPDQKTSTSSGNIKPGKYDVLISIVISNQLQKIWLNDFDMKAGKNYAVNINLNAGEIIYEGGNRDVRAMRLYPAGTAARQTGNPAPVDNLEIIDYQNTTIHNACPPGMYDVLLDIKNGQKYEWKKNVVINTGTKTSVR